MEISQETMAQLLQVGSQYFLPAAALLRAMYWGWRGKLPEGIGEIVVASFFSGFTSVADHTEFDLRAVILSIIGNTMFMAGLLSFIMMYLLRQPDRGKWVDGIVGGVIGTITFVVWVYVLQNTDWPVWLLPLAIAAGAAAFIALRIALRQILRLMRIATYLIGIAILFMLGAGILYIVQTFLLAPSAVG